MGKILIPIYQCDKCGKQFEDPTDLRLFFGTVQSADEQITFIETKDHSSPMYCKKCTIDILFGDVTKITSENQDKITNTEIIKNQQTSDEIIVNDIHKALLEDEKEIKDLPKRRYKKKKDEKEKIEETPKDEKEKIEETPKDENKSSLPFETLEDGKYLMLFKIEDDEQEIFVAKTYGHSNVEELRKSYGETLKGLYISANQFVNELQANTEIIEAQIINTFIFGIPNVIKKLVFIDQTLHHIAFILKEDFELNVAPIELENDNETELLKDDSEPESIIEEFEEDPKENLEEEEEQNRNIFDENEYI